MMQQMADAEIACVLEVRKDFYRRQMLYQALSAPALSSSAIAKTKAVAARATTAKTYNKSVVDQQ
ncbi:MAG: hypothetical protein IJ466_10265 [Clostridia bacterium]|nr:hypothetical protein [Clostridia bacterium]